MLFYIRFLHIIIHSKIRCKSTKKISFCNFFFSRSHAGRGGAEPIMKPHPIYPPDDMQERKKRVRRGEEENTSYPLIISQLQPGDFGAFFGFLEAFFQKIHIAWQGTATYYVSLPCGIFRRRYTKSASRALSHY